MAAPDRHHRRPLARVLTALAAVALAVALASCGGGETASQTVTSNRSVESIFQDDQLLIDSPTATVARTLDTLRSLGVDRLRVTVLWAAIAPPVKPKGFDAANPGDYAPAAWAPFDRLVELAAARGIGVAFNVTAPGPLWAMATPAPSAKVATHYRPSAGDFGQFVAAVGTRYNGRYVPSGGGAHALPRVSYWTIWNEPNQPGWLAPQWHAVGGRRVVASPVLYREYVDAAFASLERTGHGPSTDTILIGELAPLGIAQAAAESPVRPMVFVRALYCVDANYQPLRGPQAAALDCPAGGSTAAFVAAHPALFQSTGFAHHPYSFFLAPQASISDPNFVALSNLSRLERGLDRIFAVYGVHRQLPIYLTEYGYETNPPNPFRGVSLEQQAAYLDEAQYMAWADRRVHAMAQFLLVDSPPDTSFPRGSIGYWSTFQTGLEFVNGARKPSFAAYRLPIWIPRPAFHGGGQVFVWGMLRPAPNGSTQHAELQWRGSSAGGWRTLATLTTSNASGFLTDKLAVPGSGAVRIEWTAGPGTECFSRAVTVRKTG